MASLIENPGFETDDFWVEEAVFGGIANRHSPGGHSGGFEGRTDTSNPFSPGAYARLYQAPAIPVPVGTFKDALRTLAWWHRVVFVNPNGPRIFFVRITTVDGGMVERHLHYWYHPDHSALPSDTPTEAYIDMGTAINMTWSEAVRNFLQDYRGKFGDFGLTHVVTEIRLESLGFVLAPPTGQDVRWDDITFDTLADADRTPGAFPGKAGATANSPVGVQ